MEEALNEGHYDDYDANFTDCTYFGTEHTEVKIYLIGVFATFIALLSIIFNTFFTLVFLTNPSIRKSSVFYFGVLAVIDTIMAVNYIAVMSIPDKCPSKCMSICRAWCLLDYDNEKW
ncbi:unnamed protein product [Nippostrongylus brasiliensis]|uniref:G_PROTEIN_RECEP_F1_2 domain-containing protein n=1 Tax=Nippostrongylus brasiliensis TaxID=27835 RepID=A0A0N4YFP5_NIPBR|nr:unnamed protein product [Nippostrongylus brasiliensis]